MDEKEIERYRRMIEMNSYYMQDRPARANGRIVLTPEQVAAGAARIQENRDRLAADNERETVAIKAEMERAAREREMRDASIPEHAEKVRALFRISLPSLADLVMSDARMLNFYRDLMPLNGFHPGTLQYLCENLLPAPVESAYTRGRTHYL